MMAEQNKKITINLPAQTSRCLLASQAKKDNNQPGWEKNKNNNELSVGGLYPAITTFNHGSATKTKTRINLPWCIDTWCINAALCINAFWCIDASWCINAFGASSKKDNNQPVGQKNRDNKSNDLLKNHNNQPVWKKKQKQLLITCSGRRKEGKQNNS